MFLKIHRLPDGGDIVAVCDRELINTTITSETMKIIISDSFYGSSPATEAEVTAALTRAGNINLIGERAVGIAVGMGLVDRSTCIMIGKIPHAQVYQL
jgi:uncharacterized protein